MTVADLYREAQAHAGVCESLSELREVVADVLELGRGRLGEFEYWTERAWRECRPQSLGKLDLPGLIRKYDRDIVAAAGNMSVSLLTKLRTASGVDSRRLNEDHLLGWMELDLAFDPTLELLRRKVAREEVQHARQKGA